MRGWFVSDNGMARFRIKDVTGIHSRSDGATAYQGTEQWSLSIVERDRLITQIEQADGSVAVPAFAPTNPEMFRYSHGAFPISGVRSWVVYPETTVVQLWDAPAANLKGDDVQRFLDVMESRNG